MKKKVKELDKVQDDFDAKQKGLIEAGVAPADAILLTSQNKIQRVVEQCRRSHGGPITEASEIENIFEKIHDEKGRKTALILEIRYRKFTVLNIKEGNPLFKQQNTSVDQLVTNLKLLLQKTDLALASTATMADLEKVLSKDADTPSDQPASLESDVIPGDQLPSLWPPDVGSMLL